MIHLEKGRYVARQAHSDADVAAMQALRATCFGVADGWDDIDLRSTHIVVEDRKSGVLMCCYRLLALRGNALPQCYAARFYELDGLQSYTGLMTELGRFCVAPDTSDPDIVRLAWAAMTEFVDTKDVAMLFGCSSFAGVDATVYLETFALLRARHLAPARWMPQVKAPDVFAFAQEVLRGPDMKRAMLRMPPLLRTYLLMGGWVSDHAVVDHHMKTLHVFTGLEISAIPSGRKRLLRALV